jgi:7-carboxy-7-deazaguanine synthase
MLDETIRITEIFYSLQGETSTAGFPTAFIRLTGCPLRCKYCDTEYAFFGGEKQTIMEVLASVAEFNATYITVTGGEPLAQPGCLSLLNQLCENDYRVSLETSGALPVKGVDSRVAIILDLKTPGSGEVASNYWDNIAELNSKDEIKIVLCDRQDYDWARMQLDRYKIHERGIDVLFSPSHGQLDARDLAEWVLEDNLPVRVQLQLHKQLWGDAPGK